MTRTTLPETAPAAPPPQANLWVATTPTIHDPRELHTILTTSLRALWGNLERYSATMQVVKTKSHQDDDDNDAMLLCVSCLKEHAPQIQAALTCVTPPPYLEDTLYRFDTVKIEYTSHQQDDDDKDDFEEDSLDQGGAT